ncbi:MAG: ABC transporter ATP-binding protein [Cyclobacteriaceae bacterium]|nr:ABC transporter ATP-binding protein [Cyclobacteriaceae bacterium]
MAVLEIKGLYKKYSRKDAWAVNNIDLSVPKGELLALLGESGSGKTTLLRLIAGFEEPEKGSIQVDGRVIVNANTYIPPEKRNIGMVFQEYALFPHMTINENIQFGLHKLKRADQKRRTVEVLKIVGLMPYASRYPHQLSGGQQQRAALARALAPNPSMLLLDEPFSNLDGVLKDQVREELKYILKETNTTAIFVTHDTKDALATADRIALLKEGKIQQTGKPEELYRKPVNIYTAGFLGKVNIIQASVKNDGFDSQVGFIPFPEIMQYKEKVTLVVRPEHLHAGNSPSHFIKGKVDSVNYFGDSLFVTVKVSNEKGTCKLIYKSSCSCSFSIGESIQLKLDVSEMHLLDTCWPGIVPGALAQ